MTDKISKNNLNAQSYINDNSDNMITITYYSVTLDEVECIIMLNLRYNLYYEQETIGEMRNVYNITFLGPVLKSSDGEVRTFGMHSDFVDFSTTIFLYNLSKTECGIKLINKIREIDWNFNAYFERLGRHNINDTDLDITKVPRRYDKMSFKYLTDNSEYEDIAINYLINYYCYIKYMYGKDLSNIEVKDQNLMKYIDNHLKLSDTEIGNILLVYYDKFYQAYELTYSSYKKILKITLDTHSIEWDYNKFLSYLISDRGSGNVRMYSFLPYYQYFKYVVYLDDFVVDEKLLFKLKFNNNIKTLRTNVFLGANKGKSFYQNLLDIRNDSNNAIKFEKIDYHNLLIMNIFNLRFIHLTGIIHNDLHLNNVLFQKEPDFTSIYIENQALYDFSVFYKYYLHLGKLDFTIIDFGRACYINDKDIIMRRIKKVNKDFYNQYYSHINDMFEKDEYVTGYVLSLFDYIEYTQSIHQGLKWINDPIADYELLTNVVDYCYTIVETYLTGNNKKLANKLYKILKYDNYKYLPDIIKNFNVETTTETFATLIKHTDGRGGFHPIDLVIEKFFPENIHKDQTISTGIYQMYINDTN